jgi:hypothetical protein
LDDGASIGVCHGDRLGRAARGGVEHLLLGVDNLIPREGSMVLPEAEMAGSGADTRTCAPAQLVIDVEPPTCRHQSSRPSIATAESECANSIHSVAWRIGKKLKGIAMTTAEYNKN